MWQEKGKKSNGGTDFYWHCRTVPFTTVEIWDLHLLIFGKSVCVVVVEMHPA